MVDSFETDVRNADGEPVYVPTARVLDHFDHEINEVLGGVDGKKVKICLLAGSDLVRPPASCRPCANHRIFRTDWFRFKQ